jgi:hypothetical protein
LWGQLGTSYEHLLRIRKEDLYRREVNLESVQGEEEEEKGSESKGESEDERHEEVLLLQLDEDEDEESKEAELTGGEEEEGE